MAVYASAARRRRAGAAVAVAMLVAGLLIGGVIGRSTATSLDEQIGAGRDGGREFVAFLRVLSLEYPQAFSGSSEFSRSSIADTVERSPARLADALDSAPWLSDEQRTIATRAVAQISAAARKEVTPDRFEAVVAEATTTVQSVFGLPPATAG